MSPPKATLNDKSSLVKTRSGDRQRDQHLEFFTTHHNNGFFITSALDGLKCVMSLYYEAAEVLASPTNAGGSLKSRIFSKKDLKSQPAQIYALTIETCKWSPVLKEIIEFADILRLERKVNSSYTLNRERVLC